MLLVLVVRDVLGAGIYALVGEVRWVAVSAARSRASSRDVAVVCATS